MSHFWIIPIFHHIVIYTARFFRCRCCKFADNDLAYSMAREQLIEEFNLVRTVRDLRMARLGLKHILGVDDYLEIKKMSKKKTLKVRERKYIKGADSDD